VQEGAAAQRSGGGATLDRGDTLKVEKKVGAEWAHAQIYKSKFREAAAAVAKAEVDAKIKQAKAKQNLDNAGQLDQFAAGLQQLENEALQSSLQNAHNIQQLGREVGSFRPRPGRVFQDSSAAAMWGAAMSLAASSFQSERSGGPNTALEIINTAIKQDLAAQEIQYDAMKTELQANQTLYSQMRASYGDAIAARTAQSAVLREAAAARLQAAGNQFLPKQAKLQAAIAQEKLIQQANADLVKAAEMTFSRTSRRAAAGAGEALIKLLPAELQQKLVNASGGADLRLLAQFGIDGAEFYRQQAGRLTEEAQAEEAAGKAGEAALVAEGEKLDRAVAAERQRVRPARPTQRGATDRVVAPPEQVVATEEVTEEVLPAGEEEVQEGAAVEVESGAESGPSYTAEEAQAMRRPAMEAQRSAEQAHQQALARLQQAQARVTAADERRLLLDDPAQLQRDLTAEERRLQLLSPAARQRMQQEIAAEKEAALAEVAELQAEAGRLGDEAERRGREVAALDEMAQAPARVAAEQAQEAQLEADAAESAQRAAAGGKKVQSELRQFVSKGYGSRSGVGTRRRAATRNKDALVADLKAGGQKAADVVAAIDATVPPGAWRSSVRDGLRREPDATVQDVGYALAWLGGAASEGAELRSRRIQTADQAYSTDNGAIKKKGQDAYDSVGRDLNLNDVGVAYRLLPGAGWESFTAAAQRNQVTAIQKALSGGGVDGMSMRRGTRPLTVTVQPEKFDVGSGKWVTDTSAQPVSITYRVPVALASRFYTQDRSGGKDFVSADGGLIGGTVQNPLNKSQTLRYLGTPEQQQKTRTRVSKIDGLNAWAGAMTVYGEIYRQTGSSATFESLAGGLDARGDQIMAAYKAARKSGNFATYGKPPLVQDGDGGTWKVNPDSDLAKTLGLTDQGGGDFSVTAATSKINVGPLSHFVGFMAPQRAEMDLLERGTGSKPVALWNFLDQWQRGGAQTPAAGAASFSAFLRTATRAIVDHDMTTAAGAAEIYRGATQAMQKREDGISLSRLREARKREERVPR